MNAGTSAITTSKQFTMNVHLPFTEASTGSASALGSGYVPYSSWIASCSSTFTYSTTYTVADMTVSSAVLTSQNSQFYGSVSWNMECSRALSTLLSTSSLVITFSQPILTQYSVCTFWPDYRYWVSSTQSTTTMTLLPGRDIPDFCATAYTINCTDIISNGNDIQVSMKWLDGANLISQTSSPAVASHAAVPSASPIASTGVLVSKKFGTAGYLA